MAALFWKEFRETVRWFPFCLLLVVVFLWVTVPGANGIYGVDRLSFSLVSAAGAAAFIVAVALSCAQFAFDQQTSARAFLLHRKQSARQIFHAKVAVGALFYTLAVFVPLTYTAFYLEWMGPERLPTTWYQTVPAMVFSFFCFSFYFGVSLVINRPARWLGTRLLPLFASTLTTLTYFFVSSPSSIFAVVILGVGMSLLIVLAFASRTAFESGENCVASATTKVVLFLSSIAAASAALAAPTLFVGSTANSWREVAIDRNGDPWLVNLHSVVGIHDNQRTERWPMVETASQLAAQEVPEKWNPGSIVVHPIEGQPERSWDFRELSQTDDGVWFLDNDGRILAYEYRGNQNRAVGFRVIDKRSIDGSNEQDRKRFIDPSVSNAFGEIEVLVDAQGVYALAPKNDHCYTLLNQPIDAVGRWTQGDSRGLLEFVSIVVGTKVTIYHFKSSNSNPSGVELVLDQTFDIENKLGSYRSHFTFTELPNKTEPTNWTWVEETSLNEYRVTRKRLLEEKPSSYTFKMPAEQTSGINSLTIGSVVSVGMCVFFFLEMVCAYVLNTNLIMRSEYAVEPLLSAAPMITVMAIIATGLTYVMARVRGLSKRQQIVWSLIGFLCGIGSALAVLAIYPQVHLVECARCGRRRRVDRDRCENCNAEWELPATEGIEIVEPWENNRESRELLTH